MATTKGTRRRVAGRNGPASPSAGRATREADAGRVAASIKNVSDPTRLNVMLILAEGEQHVSELCERVGQSQPALSHHLALLRHGGLVAPRREGKRNFYRLTDSGRTLVDAVRGLVASEVAPGPPDRIPLALLKEVGEVTTDPEGWMRRPNPRFDGRRPVELLGTPEEPRILLIIKAAQQGFFA